MKKRKFRFSPVVVAPLAIAALVASASVAQAVPPVAVNDIFSTTQTSVDVFLPVLANDSDPDGTALSVNTVFQGNQGGTVTVSDDGTGIVYTPARTFSGTETFSYTAIDAAGEVSNTAFVTVSVAPPPSTFNSAISGNGHLDVTGRRMKKRPYLSFSAFNGNFLAGEVLYRNPVDGTTFRSTEITAVQVFGNTGTIFGFGTFDGFTEVGFILTTTDLFPIYITRGDIVTLESGTDEFPISSTFNRGGSRVVGGGEVDGGPFPETRLPRVRR